jgi:hypothetical protein
MQVSIPQAEIINLKVREPEPGSEDTSDNEFAVGDLKPHFSHCQKRSQTQSKHYNYSII